MAQLFLTRQRPDEEVVALLESVLLSARQGLVRTVHIVAVNAINQAEADSAGDLSEVKSNVLAGALLGAALEIKRP